MKPVFQQRDENGNWDNCFSACVASVLELQIEDVPDFMYRDGKLNDAWFDEFIEWLRPQGLSAMIVVCHEADFPLKDAYYLIGGKAKRGIMHSVVGFNSEIVHDPFPLGSGFSEVVDYIVFVRTFV